MFGLILMILPIAILGILAKSKDDEDSLDAE